MRRRVDHFERARLQAELFRAKKSISRNIQTRTRLSLFPWREVGHDRHGKEIAYRAWHLFEGDYTCHPRDWQKDPGYIGSFPTRDEAVSYAKGYSVGRVQIAMGNGPKAMGYKFELRQPSNEVETPQIILTDRGPETH